MELNKEYLLELAKKEEKICIYIETQEQWDEIINSLGKYKGSITSSTFEKYPKICLDFSTLRLMYSHLEFFKKEGFKIFSYEDCCKKEIKEELKTINIRIGDEIGKLIITKTALELLKNGEKIRVF